MYQGLNAQEQRARDHSRALLLAAGKVQETNKPDKPTKPTANRKVSRKPTTRTNKKKHTKVPKKHTKVPKKQTKVPKKQTKVPKKQIKVSKKTTTQYALGDSVEAVWNGNGSPSAKFWPGIVFSRYRKTYGVYFLDGFSQRGCRVEQMRPAPADAAWAKIRPLDLVGQAFKHEDADAMDTPSLLGQYEVLQRGTRKNINKFKCGHVSGKKFFFGLAYVYKKLLKDIFPFANSNNTLVDM